MTTYIDLLRSRPRRIALFSSLYFLLVLFTLYATEETILHVVSVKLDPAEHRIEGIDRIRLPQRFLTEEQIFFHLHGNLSPRSLTEGITLHLIDNPGGDDSSEFPGAMNMVHSNVPVNKYEIRTKGGRITDEEFVISIAFEGVIHHPLRSDGEEYARSFSQTPGIISEEGSVLSGSTYWIPWFGDHLVTYRLEVELPAGRKAVSQGKRLDEEERTGGYRVVWDCPEPMDDIYLIEAPFIEYADKAGSVLIFAFLRKQDPGLAGKYIEATAQYLEMYNRLIGPYPYAKFALVENFWETGYGMPSFTLLGPKIIRFPFILRSSYPHEILHNWWGNSVFVDYATGNWCEGLTAYLADHLIKEQQGRGEEYRRDTLKRYLSYVQEEKDFPLSEFRARHDAATEAVGYGKSLMLFHMLRVRLGNKTFINCLRTFYDEFLFKRASFDDLAECFSRVSGGDLTSFFSQWVDRIGSPELCIHSHDYSYSRGRGSSLTLEIRQTQEEPPFEIFLPLAVYEEDENRATVYYLDMKSRNETFSMECAGPITRVEVDPYFDVFRKLLKEETPPTIGQAFGAQKVLILIPSENGEEEEELRVTWEGLAESWRGNQKEGIECKRDDEIDSLPEDQAVWVLGGRNLWRPDAGGCFTVYGFEKSSKHISLLGEKIPLREHCFVVAMRHPLNEDLALCWVFTDMPEAIPGLGRKLPHYGKYSYLAFNGPEPTNVAKGQWPIVTSPLTINFEPGRQVESKLPSRLALADLPTLVDLNRLRDHCAFLSDDRLKGRGLGTAELDEAADYISRSFESYGLRPGGEAGSYFQTWEDEVCSDGKRGLCMNVIGIIPGNDPSVKGRPVVVGAHYDHLGLGWPDVHKGDEGKIHNGADDNASGVSIMLELARLMGSTLTPSRRIVFAAFTGEEAGLKGSKRYVSSPTEDSETGVYAMINLDTLGRLNGKKLLAFGTDSAREWSYIIFGTSYTTGLDAQCVPKDPGAGDHVSFLNAGIPAIHLFSGIHDDYHRPTDDLEKLDFEGMAKITEFVKEIIIYLADRREPLTVNIGDGVQKISAEPERAKDQKKRRASLGTMPDFTYQGEGVRVASVIPGSPAEGAGLMTHDVILRMNDYSIQDLKALADALKKFNPGEMVTVEIQRGCERHTFKVRLSER